MSRYIDADALCKLARNHVDGTVDCNDIMRFPSIDAVPVDFINQKIVELQSCASQHFDDGHKILATCVLETIRLLGSILKEWRGKDGAE